MNISVLKSFKQTKDAVHLVRRGRGQSATGRYISPSRQAFRWLPSIRWFQEALFLWYWEENPSLCSRKEKGNKQCESAFFPPSDLLTSSHLMTSCSSVDSGPGHLLNRVLSILRKVRFEINLSSFGENMDWGNRDLNCICFVHMSVSTGSIFVERMSDFQVFWGTSNTDGDIL